MKKVKSRFLKVIFLALLILFFVITIVFLWFFIPSLKTKLDVEKFKSSNVTVEIFCDNETKLKNAFNDEIYITYGDIPQHVIDSFVCLEDKRFFVHNGVDWYRIAGAVLESVKSRRFKEGASTITQQLIKNTHLTNEKSITRKMTEARLAVELEKKMPKEKILEIYLNSVYFGNSCYGIEQASKYYFNKETKDLSVSQSAMLAGLLRAPNVYAPDKNIDKCIARRNLVLDLLAKNGKITSEQAKNAKQEQVDLERIGLKQNDLKTYEHMAICEVAQIFGITPLQAKSMDINVFTFLDKEKQIALSQSVKQQKAKTKARKNAQKMAISIDNQTCGVNAFFANTNQDPFVMQRQIGSTAKPIICLAPSFEQNLVTPSTMILDEQTNFGGYKPANSSDKYDGWITVRESIAKSKNIPAVKMLNALNKDELKTKLQRLWGWDDFEINLNMALGNFEQGLTIKQLAESYLTFANDGNFVNCTFIKRIEDKNGRILYQHNPEKRQIFRSDTCFLTTQVLKDVVNFGTARSLSTDFDLAGKTGTVGKKGSANNSDAIFCSYTTKDTTVFWTFADYDDLLASGINGSTLPVDMAKSYYNKIYANNKPLKFRQPDSVVKIKIDKVMLKKGKIAIANNFLPSNEVFEEYFSIYNVPKEISDRIVKSQNNDKKEDFNNIFDRLLFKFKKFKYG